MMRLSPAQFEELRARGVQAAQIARMAKLPAGARVAPARTTVRRGFTPQHKYKAQRTVADGISFASKSEAARYHWLMAEQAAGRLVFFLMQTRIDIPGSTYRLDFLEFWADGRIVWLDVKGFETEAFKIKRRAIEAIYPFKITTARQRGRGDNKDWEYK